MTPHRSQFRQYSTRHSDSVRVRNSQHYAIIGINIVELNLPGRSTLVLHNVRHVLELSRPLISVGKLDETCICAGFSSGGWTLHKGNLLLAREPKVHSLYPLYVTLREGDLFLVDIPVLSLWHGRLGHLSKAGITHLSRDGYIPKLSFSDHQFYEHCQYGKQVAASHPTSALRESRPLDFVYSNACGPMPHQSLGGASYFVSFIEDSTRKVLAYPIRTKDRVFLIFSDWLAMVENQTGRKLKCL